MNEFTSVQADGRTHGERVKQAILETGLALWRVDPGSVSARRIGQILGMSHGGILYHWRTTAALKKAIAAHAVVTGCIVVVPMLIAAKHPAVKNMPGVERARYLAGC